MKLRPFPFSRKEVELKTLKFIKNESYTYFGQVHEETFHGYGALYDKVKYKFYEGYFKEGKK